MSDGAVPGEYGHPVPAAVDAVEAALAECVDAALWSVSGKDLDDLVPRAYALLGRVMGSLVLPLVREADRRGLPAELDAPSTAAWLRWLLRVTPSQATKLVGLAQAIDGGGLSATGVALAQGRISTEHAQAIARAVAELPEEAAAWVPAAAEEHLLAAAEQHDPYQVGRLGQRIVAVVDPEAGDELLRRQVEAEDRKAEQNRQFDAVSVGQRRVRVSGWFDVEGWQIVRAALDPLAAPRPADDGGPDLRSRARRMGDALVELAARSLRVGDLPEQGGERPTVVVTMAYDKLAEQVGTGSVDTGEPLPAEAVRRYACDAKIIPAVLGGPGRPVDLGRSTRIISAALRRALTLRDGGCTFPLCEIPGKWCDVHHLDHWADGGRTDLNNTALVCGAHHTTTHHHGWIIRMAGDGLPEWIPPAWIDPHRRPRRHHRHKPPPPHTPT
jgi:hypothetical protein